MKTQTLPAAGPLGNRQEAAIFALRAVAAGADNAPMRTRVKIEGLMDVPTALAVAELGADCIGLVFADSPRRVAVETAADIVAALGPWAATVGVFVNATADEINDVIARTGIGCVQLHGDEPPELTALVRRPCIKAFGVRDAGWLGQARRFAEAAGTNLAGIVLDAFDPRARGGTGKSFNWQLVADARSAGEIGPSGLLAGGRSVPIILAGGLTPDNVAAAIGAVRPWGVDVASGVESSPGRKDMAKVAAFIAAARGAAT
jgi:phosphoribosylanthranilate isomerase